MRPDQVPSHKDCRLGKWYYEGEGKTRFSQNPGYREMEVPHTDVHRYGIEALEARQQGDTVTMLRRVEAMEKSSIAVIQSLQQMAA